MHRLHRSVASTLNEQTKGRQKVGSTELERNTLEEIRGFILFPGLGKTKYNASPRWF